MEGKGFIEPELGPYPAKPPRNAQFQTIRLGEGPELSSLGPCCVDYQDYELS